MAKDYSSSDERDSKVTVSVDVSRIVKYVSAAGVLIVAIIFGTKTFLKMLEKGFIDIVE